MNAPSQNEALESDNWQWQERMMDAMMTGLERSLVGFTCVLPFLHDQLLICFQTVELQPR